MPVPVLWVGVTAAAVGTLIYRLRRGVENKRVLVIGPRGAGKSRLHRLLTRGERSLRDLGVAPESFGFVTKKVRMRDLRWKLSYVDSPSSNEEIGVFDWGDHLAGMDLVVFVVDGVRLADDGYRAMAELLAITCRLNAADDLRWMLVMSHADKLPGVSAQDLRGHHEIARVLGDHDPQFVNLQEWESAARVVRRVVANLK